jgi:muramoyltetrapeptide carboxypeptidase
MAAAVPSTPRKSRTKALKPRRLGSGSVIGIAAPSGPFDPPSFERGLEVLRTMGFRVRVPDGLFAAKGYLAGTDAHRAAVFESLFCDPGIDAVMAARGGYGSLRILPLLDFARLAAHPKVLIGFSDVTALLTAISSRCGLVTFHGPMVTTLAGASERTLSGLRDAVASDRPVKMASEAAVTLRPGVASGTVCGGNLNTLCHLVGTPFAPRFRNRIVFLEDRGEAPYRVDRMLTHMKTAGCFESVKGLVLGSFTDCGSPEEIWAIAEEIFHAAGFPILAGLQAGHTDPNLTLPLGVRAELDASSRELSFECGTEG